MYIVNYNVIIIQNHPRSFLGNFLDKFLGSIPLSPYTPRHTRLRFAWTPLQQGRALRALPEALSQLGDASSKLGKWMANAGEMMANTMEIMEHTMETMGTCPW